MEQPNEFASLGKEVINERALIMNLQAVDYCRILVSAVGGCVAGILGLTNVTGFLFYGGASLIMTLLLVRKANNDPDLYFTSWSQLAFDGVLGHLLSYVLFWTFIYGLVYVY